MLRVGLRSYSICELNKRAGASIVQAPARSF